MRSVEVGFACRERKEAAKGRLRGEPLPDDPDSGGEAVVYAVISGLLSPLTKKLHTYITRPMKNAAPAQTRIQ